MKIGVFLKIMCAVTFMATLYIHLQVTIYDLAYQGKTKEQKVEKLVELNGSVRNDILRLKSSNHIGNKLLESDKQYKFAGSSNVIEVAETSSLPDIINASAKTTSGFFSKVMSLAFASSAPLDP